MEVLSSRVLVTPVDFERSVAFYRDVLGLRVYREFGVAGRTTGVVFFVGGGLLELAANGHPPLQPCAGMRLWLQVPDVDVEVSRLETCGVPVLAVAETKPWGLREAEVADPDGLILVLVEIPADHPLRRRVD